MRAWMSPARSPPSAAPPPTLAAPAPAPEPAPLPPGAAPLPEPAVRLPAPRSGDDSAGAGATCAPIGAFVKVASEDREYVFRTRDVSMTGFFLFTRVGHIYPFKIGSTLRVELYDYDQFVECKAVIVRVVREGTPESEKYPLGFGLR